MTDENKKQKIEELAASLSYTVCSDLIKSTHLRTDVVAGDNYVAVLCPAASYNDLLRMFKRWGGSGVLTLSGDCTAPTVDAKLHRLTTSAKRGERVLFIGWPKTV